MTTPKNGDTVTIDYVLKRTDGQVVGTTEQTGAQQVVLGSGQIFPLIEEALTGMEVGDARTVAVPCDKAFGQRREEFVVEIPRAKLPPEPVPQPGMQLNARTPEGKEMALIILEVREDAVKADGNHPLAGEDLTFDLTLRAIQQAA